MKKQLHVAIAKTDVQEQTATGLVYAPLVVDSQGDFMTAPDIKAASQRFMKSGRTGAIDVNHDGNYVGAFIAESMISKGDEFPAGSWVITAKIENPSVWKSVRDGELTGFSMLGNGRRQVTKLNGKKANQLQDVDIEAISLVHRAANQEKFSVIKSDAGIGDALTSIAAAIQKIGQKFEKVEKRLHDNDQRIAALSTSTSGGVRKAEPAHQRDPEVHRLLRKRDRLNDRLASIWERPDRYEPDAEREVCKSLQRIDDDLHAHGHQDKQTGLDSNSAFYFRGGSSTFITGGGSSIEDILGVGHSTRNISKADEDDIEVENCLVL